MMRASPPSPSRAVDDGSGTVSNCSPTSTPSREILFTAIVAVSLVRLVNSIQLFSAESNSTNESLALILELSGVLITIGLFESSCSWKESAVVTFTADL